MKIAESGAALVGISSVFNRTKDASHMPCPRQLCHLNNFKLLPKE